MQKSCHVSAAMRAIEGHQFVDSERVLLLDRKRSRVYEYALIEQGEPLEHWSEREWVVWRDSSGVERRVSSPEGARCDSLLPPPNSIHCVDQLRSQGAWKMGRYSKLIVSLAGTAGVALSAFGVLPVADYGALAATVISALGSVGVWGVRNT